jgi:hypothetical protein
LKRIGPIPTGEEQDCNTFNRTDRRLKLVKEETEIIDGEEIRNQRAHYQS